MFGWLAVHQFSIFSYSPFGSFCCSVIHYLGVIALRHFWLFSSLLFSNFCHLVIQPSVTCCLLICCFVILCSVCLFGNSPSKMCHSIISRIVYLPFGIFPSLIWHSVICRLVICLSVIRRSAIRHFFRSVTWRWFGTIQTIWCISGRRQSPVVYSSETLVLIFK
jgi:hypothetical protein